MPKRRSKSPEPSPTPPEPSSESWDLTQLLNTDIRQIEVADSLRRLGQIRVIDWDFKTVIPAVKKTANREVDVINLIKRTANYKIMDWDFRGSTPETSLSPDLHALSSRLHHFLQYITENLIDQPAQAQIRAEEIAPKVLRFTIALTPKDVSMLVGREGFTATAIRTIIKATAETHGIHVLLRIHSHQEDKAVRANENPAS